MEDMKVLLKCPRLDQHAEAEISKSKLCRSVKYMRKETT